MLLAVVICLNALRIKPWRFWTDIRAAFDMLGRRLILEMRRADVIDVLGIERRQPIPLIKRRPTGIVGALKALLGRIAMVSSKFRSRTS
jgi:hypothetical protein